jgi:hypothetical protein
MSTSPEQGFNQGQIPAARAVGMGEALNALGVSTPALFMNPANMALARVYHLEALGAYSPESKRDTFGLAIVDSVLNAQHISGGLGGTWNELDPDGIHRVWSDVRLGLAMPLGDNFALGATGRYLNVQQHTAAGPFGPSPASDGSSSSAIFNQVTFDLGATAVVSDFRIGVVGHNLTNPGTALAPTLAGGGIGYGSQMFSLEIDGMADFTTFGQTTGRIMGGVEVFLANHYALRGGWKYDTGWGVNTPSLGFGYIDIKWSIEAAVTHDLIGDSRAETFGVLSLKYFYDAVGSTSVADEPDAL